MERDDEEPRVPVLEREARIPARFAELVHRLGGTLQRMAYRVVGDHGVAEEVVQDSFAKLARDPVLQRPDAEVEAWLRRVTLNGAFNRARGERRARDRDDRAGRLDAAGSGGEQGTPLAAVLAAEERDRVRATLQDLPERQRAVLVLRAGGYSYAEVASTLGIATGSVGVLLARAERAFRAAYEAAGTGTTDHQGEPR